MRCTPIGPNWTQKVTDVLARLMWSGDAGSVSPLPVLDVGSCLGEVTAGHQAPTSTSMGGRGPSDGGDFIVALVAD